MPKVSKESATQGGEFGPVTDRADQVGDYTVNFTSFREPVDGTPLLRGLVDDRCQCPHWGYVLSGRIAFVYAGGEEEFVAGDAFYTPPGHTPAHSADSEILLFSPAAELAVTEEVMQRNMAAMSG